MFIWRSVSSLGLLVSSVSACSNILVTPGAAAADAGSIISYNADSGSLYGSLYHYPASVHESGSMRSVHDWDSGKYLGEIPEAPDTFNVVGNINEHGLIIGETTYGGLADLQTQSAAKVDYGSLIWITLQRARTAREAITTIDELMSTYGYASEGESFSIADQKEVWIMEIIGKGEYELGAVWVARRLPDGAVSGHANQARITTFPLNDPENCLYSRDVISFARSRGFYSGSDEAFSFSDVYDPVTFSGARFCDARVWSFFGAIMGEAWANTYLDYAQGFNLTNRMPLWVFPEAKLTAADVMEHMRNHYENTPLDMSGTEISDVGAMAFGAPYRWRPMTWSASNGGSYLHERAIATQQTGWNFVAQSRANYPRELSGLLWFGVDDSSTCVHFPVYGSATRVSSAFGGAGAQDGVVPPMMTFDMGKAFPVFNLVANWAYSRWAVIYPELKAEIVHRERSFTLQLPAVEQKALQLYEAGDVAGAVEVLTAFSETAGDNLVKDWAAYFGYLFMRFRDGYVVEENPDSTSCGCTVNTASYGLKWYDRIVENTGDHYLVPEDNLKTISKVQSKLSLKAFK